MDPIQNLMLTLKNGWKLTGELAVSGSGTGTVVFSTAWYDTKITFPQVSIRPSPSRQTPLTTGTPLYQSSENIYINLWVRPKQDSNTSIGWAKNTIFTMRQEVDRILVSGANIVTVDSISPFYGTSNPYTGSAPYSWQSKEYILMGSWRDLTETNKDTGRPVIFRQEMIVTDLIFKSYSKI